jgi:hypothetical protein
MCTTSKPISPGFDLAENRIQIRAVVVEQSTGAVHDVANLQDVLLEHAERRRIGQHQSRSARAHRVAQRAQVDVAIATGGDLVHAETAHRWRLRDWCHGPRPGR